MLVVDDNHHDNHDDEMPAQVARDGPVKNSIAPVNLQSLLAFSSSSLELVSIIALQKSLPEGTPDLRSRLAVARSPFDVLWF